MDILSFAEFEISEFEISRVDCITLHAGTLVLHQGDEFVYINWVGLTLPYKKI